MFTSCTFALYISYTFTSSEAHSTNDVLELLFLLYVQPSKMQGTVSFNKSGSKGISFPSIFL